MEEVEKKMHEIYAERWASRVNAWLFINHSPT
jgi:hypothetical protein